MLCKISDPPASSHESTRLRESLGKCRPAIDVWVYCSLMVWAGAWVGYYFVPLSVDDWLLEIQPHSFVCALSNFDGKQYKCIATYGYWFSTSGQSTIAFFPGYPCVGWLVHLVTRLPLDVVMPLISNFAFLGSVCLFQLYLESGTGESRSSTFRMSLLALCLWPTSFFFRMAYSESLFLLMTLLAFVGIRRNWPLWLIAVIVGAATGMRSVGIALLLPLAVILWDRSATWRQLIQRTILLGPLSLWGLIAFMIHLQVCFGNPLAFVDAQRYWRKVPPLSGFKGVFNLVTLEPIWDVYDPSSPTVWYGIDGMSNAIFSMQFWNPIYFLLCAALIVYGTIKGWLTRPEWLLSAGLIAIPYIMQSHCMGMQSQGRFTSIVFPMFIVLGRLMNHWPLTRRYVVLSLMGVQSFYWSVLFGASYCIW